MSELSKADRKRWRDAAAGHGLADFQEAEDFIVVALDALEDAERERTRDKERIGELEKLAQDVADSGYGDAVMGMRDTARALLEVQDEDHD